MVFAFFRSRGYIKGFDELREGFQIEDLIWLDLLQPTSQERSFAEELFNIKLQSQEEIEEIESSSKFSETENQIIINSNFMVWKDGTYNTYPVSLILKNNVLISFRNTKLQTFGDTIRRIKNRNKYITSAYQIILALFDSRIDLDADYLEAITKDISRLSKEVNIEQDLDEEVLLSIGTLQETTMMIHENIVDKQRIFSAMLKSDFFPEESYEFIRIMLKDIGSLLDHTQFSFERLEFLQNTFLGLVDFEQNKVIKIFTVVTVIFMPPTLIASIYGMNFKHMPELSWPYSYPLALLIMVAASVGTLWFFKRKKWL
ncbi:MAG TPA: magnesium/cobalt transporter CorA [Bacteroidetes bacterium]|nr:magnesium/cobalt transporter CorA [Bacteroidota bacterium]